MMAVRVGWGAAMFAAPDATARLTGAPGQPYLTRAFAAREALLGIGYLRAGSPAERDRWFLAALAGDGADIAGALLGARRGELDARTAALFAGGAAGWLALGAALQAWRPAGT